MINDKTVKILIAEDEMIIAMDIKRMLQKIGYNVLATVTTGNEIIRRVETENPNLVIMDINLGGQMNGIQAANKILSDHNDIKVLFVTGSNDDSTIEEVKKAHPCDFILKPFSEVQLKKAVQICLEGVASA